MTAGCKREAALALVAECSAALSTTSDAGEVQELLRSLQTRVVRIQGDARVFASAGRDARLAAADLKRIRAVHMARRGSRAPARPASFAA